jgi:serine/threonine protein phosphatase Stp1
MTRISLIRRWTRDAAPTEPMVEAIEAAARTHVGKVRQINEDRFLVRSERHLWAIADGMGGHSRGTEAANAAVDELAALADAPEQISAPAIRAALASANRKIYDNPSGRQGTSGTTIVVAWLDRDRLTVFWAGDSRAYCIRHGKARCLTKDHSVVQDLLDAGEISEREAQRHPYANLVTRALGVAAEVELDETVVHVRPNDRLLLCSDGVSRSLDLGDCAVGNSSIGRFADDILCSALRRDGGDNATIVAIQLNALPPL